METAVAVVGLAITIMGLIGTAIYLWLKAKFDQYDKHIDEEHDDRAEDQKECTRKRQLIFDKIEILFNTIEKLKTDIQEERMNNIQKIQTLELKIMEIKITKNGAKNDA